jgi:hypothetical protein
MCSNLRIEIKGIYFPANLVVIHTQGIDVILGMNWLHKNQATVNYDKRTLRCDILAPEMVISWPKA